MIAIIAYFIVGIYILVLEAPCDQNDKEVELYLTFPGATILTTDVVP